MSASVKKVVAVALSGGVDSAVTAATLIAQGHDVVALTMRLGPTSAGAVRDARAVADHLGIPHHVLDLEEPFLKGVVQPFASAYARGQTPLPCAVCNRLIKFGDLFDAARRLGADLLATGHYVRRVDGPDGPALHRAADLSRDQSYFLFAVPRERLGRVLFPLGAIASKAETRARAGALGIPVEQKPDSQDLCFAPGGGHTDIVLKYRPDAAEPGPIVDLDGTVLGQHKGLIHHTVGQRRGLGVGGTVEPLYVVRLEPETRTVVVGPKAALACRRFFVEAFNWLGPGELPAHGLRGRVKIRNAAPPVAASLEPLTGGAGRGVVVLDEPVFGVAPGQAAVFYGAEDDPAVASRLLGGGWIQRDDGGL